MRYNIIDTIIRDKVMIKKISAKYMISKNICNNINNTALSIITYH